MTSFAHLDEVAVVDVETTGLDPKANRIVAIAVAIIRLSNFDEAQFGTCPIFGAMVNPLMPIEPAASRINGIRDRDVADMAPFSNLAHDLRKFIGEKNIVAHNAPFDSGFLEAEFKRCGVTGLGKNKTFCTMRRSAQHMGLYRVSLADAVKHFRVGSRSGRFHTAGEDVYLCARLAAKLRQIDVGR
jgi:DNA polymerase III subunit epsilon